jgi:hypothetical protein
MWPLNDPDDDLPDVRHSFGRRYGWHLREAADAMFRVPGDHGRLAALWVQQMLRRGELYRDCDTGRVILRLPIGPWTFDFDIYWDQAGGDAPVRVGTPDSLARDCYPISAADYSDDDLRTLRLAVAGSSPAGYTSLLPQLARLHGRR